MEPLQVSKKRPLASGYEVNYYRVIFTLFGFAYLFSYYYSNPDSTTLIEFLVPRSLFALLPLLLAASTFAVKWIRDHIKDVGSGFFLVCSLYLIGFLAMNGFHTHYEIGIITLVLISNLHLNKVLYIVLYNVIVLTALEFVFIAASPSANVQPVLFFIFLLLVMLLCIYYQLYRIRYHAKEEDIDQLMDGVVSGNPDAWMIFEAPGLIAKDAGSNALKLFAINTTHLLDEVSLRTLIAAGTANESDSIIKNILSGTITGLKTQCRKLTGELFWADITSFRIPGRPNIIYCRFLDISENRWSQEDANENAIRFRRYLDNISEGLIVCDVQGVIRMVNRTALLFFESEQSLLRTGKNINEFLDKTATEKFNSLLIESEVSGTVFLQREFLSEDGKIKFTVDGVKDLIDNKPEFLIKISLNVITAPLSKNELPVHINQVIYSDSSENLFLATSLPVALSGPDGNITASNTAFSILTGYSVDELNKLRMENLVHPEDIYLLKDLQNNSFAGNPVMAVIRLINKNSSSLIVNCNYTNINKSSGEQKSLYLLNDITKYKITETALQQAGANVNAVIENTDAPIFSTDFNHRITVMNSAFHLESLKRTGIKPAIGEDVRNFLQKEKRQEWEALFQKVMKGNKSVLDEIIRYPDGSIEHFEVSCYPITSSANLVIGVSVLYRKVTERIRIEGELIKAKETAESATKAKSDFLATMSHEIRTPLNGVLGMAQLLNGTPLNESQKEYVDAIKLSGEALLSVINDVLDYSKIESGKMDLENKPFEVTTCVKESFDILRYKAAEKGNRLSYHIDERIPNLISGDKARLRQILVNLLGNAIKFTDKGTIHIEVALLKKNDQEIELRFAVQDSGIGLTREQINRLFQTFTQADTSTYGKYGGSGLGLSISQRLALLMRGTIWVESEYGKGAIFYFTIIANSIRQEAYTQIATSHVQDDSKSKSPVQILNDKDIANSFPLRILLAEDNEVNQLLAKKLFQQLGYETELVTDGKSAVENYLKSEYDIIFMDVQMPVMNGIEATIEIRNQIGEKRQPVIIAMTALALEGDKEKCLNAGMDDYLSKPVRIESLKRIIFAYGKRHLKTANGSKKYSDTELVDKKVALRLIDMSEDDPTFLAKLTGLFIKQSNESIEEIIRLAAAGDFTSTYQAAHKLKGSSLNLGAKLLTETCKIIEASCISNDQETLTKSVNELRSIYESTILLFKKMTEVT